MTALESLHICSRFVPQTKILTNTVCRNSSLFFSSAKKHPKNSISSSSTQRCSLSSVAPLEAILFDTDGTLCDSDPFHYSAFREMLQEIGFNNGEPITEEFFVKDIHGKHNDEYCRVLFPDWDLQKAQQFMEDKEAMFRRLVVEQLKPLTGFQKLGKWIEDRGLKRAAVTNAPRPNAELMISQLGLNDFFEAVIIAGECERAKPFPDPYLKGLQALEASPGHTFVFEGCFNILICPIWNILSCRMIHVVFPEGFCFRNQSWVGCWNASGRCSIKVPWTIAERCWSYSCY